jgi:hypothetical protein
MMANAVWYTIRATDRNGERVQFSSTRKAEIDRCRKRWESEGYTEIHLR